MELGATGYTTMACFGAGRRQVSLNPSKPKPCVRIEVIAPRDACERIMEFLSREVQPHQSLTYCVETVQVPRLDPFVAEPNPGERQEDLVEA